VKTRTVAEQFNKTGGIMLEEIQLVDAVLAAVEKLTCDHAVSVLTAALATIIQGEVPNDHVAKVIAATATGLQTFIDILNEEATSQVVA
jgi:hypothetical protein